MPKLKVDPEKLISKIVTPDIYELQFNGFKPKRSAKGDSTNLNAVFEVVNNPTFNGAVCFENMSMKMERTIQDFVHACGLVMEPDGSIPGEFIMPNDDQNSDPTQWKYTGPLAGIILKAEVIPTTYQGRMRNNVKRYICAVQDCAIKYPDIVHSNNLISNK